MILLAAPALPSWEGGRCASRDSPAPVRRAADDRVVPLATLRALHRFWGSVVLILVGSCVWDGVGTAAVGNRNATTNTEVLRWLLQWGGGLRAHGVILLFLAGWLLYGLGRRDVTDEPIRWALIVAVAYSAVIVASVFASWVLHGYPWQDGGGSWSGPSKWGAFGAIFTALALSLRTSGGRSVR